MKNTLCIFFLASMIIIVSCNNSSKNNPLANILDKPIKHSVNIKSDIFNKQFVKTYIAECTKEEKKEAQKVFLKAIDAYRNNKKIDDALPLFKESILLFPTANTYFEYGNATLEKGNAEEAIKLYKMSDALGYEPISNVLYNMACAYSKNKDASLAYDFLEYAIEAGYKNYNNIKNDADLSYLKENRPLTLLLDSATQDIESPKEVEYTNFLNNFKTISYPYKLDLTIDSLINYDAYISYGFEPYVSEMRTVDKFSREVGKSFYYQAKLTHASENYDAVIYVIDDYMSEIGMKQAVLVTYTHGGKIIDKKIVAGVKLIKDPYKKLEIQNANTLLVSSYKTLPVNEDEYPQELKVGAKIKQELIKIDSEGKISSSATLLSSL